MELYTSSDLETPYTSVGGPETWYTSTGGLEAQYTSDCVHEDLYTLSSGVESLSIKFFKIRIMKNIKNSLRVINSVTYSLKNYCSNIMPWSIIFGQ